MTTHGKKNRQRARGWRPWGMASPGAVLRCTTDPHAPCYHRQGDSILRTKAICTTCATPGPRLSRTPGHQWSRQGQIQQWRQWWGVKGETEEDIPWGGLLVKCGNVLLKGLEDSARENQQHLSSAGKPHLSLGWICTKFRGLTKYLRNYLRTKE